MKINDFVSRIVAYYKSGMSIHVKGKIGRGKSSGIEGGVKAIAKASAATTAAWCSTRRS
jgi:hypothetical protein